jgi:hypothetical protein
MPTPKSEDAKKHGDKLEPLIERTTGEEPAEASGKEDPAQLQDDDEDVENDAVSTRRDINPRH